MDPVLKAGIAHFWFVTIHPFVQQEEPDDDCTVDLADPRTSAIAPSMF